MIPFGDLKRQHQGMKQELEGIVCQTMDSGWFILGKELEKFEENFAQYCGDKHAIGVGNATDAIFLALRALNIGRGDEVVTVANTAIPTCSAIVASGARPILVDVGKDYLMDPTKIEKVISPKTKAIVPVHLYGQTCDMDRITEIARKRNLAIVEDCAQAHGAKFRNKRTPIVNLGCFSFYPSKNLGAYGDGGMIVTDNEEIANTLRLIRNYGQPKTYVSTMPGYNSRLDEIQAAILNAKLKRLEGWNQRRQELASIYDDRLRGFVETPIKHQDRNHVYHLYVIRTSGRDSLMTYLKEKGVDSKIHYPVPIHLQPGFASLGYKLGDFPESERNSREILSLPMFPELTNEEAHFVCDRIIDWKALGRKPN